MSSPTRPPHYARLRKLLAALDAPVVEMWGWPGSGKRAILDGLLHDRPRVEYLPPDWLANPDRLEDRIWRGPGSSPELLLCGDGADGAGVEALRSLLRPGQRVVVATETRLALTRPGLATDPGQLRLRPDEIATLWRDACRRELSAAECEWLADQSSGWYLPLALWALHPETAAAPFPGEPLPLAPVESFLRERVLGPLAVEERRLLVEIAAAGAEPTAPAPTGREAALASLVARTGLIWREDGRVTAPTPLLALLSAPAAGEGGAAGSGRSDGGGELRPAVEGFARDEGGADVRIVLLGATRVERREVSGAMVPVEWSFKRPLRVLAYLASAPDLQASREEIVSILWPEASEDAVRRNLHPAISRLRRCVWPEGGPGGVVLLRDGVYSLDPALRWDVDVRRFLESTDEGAGHLARGRVEEAHTAWARAWSFYQGPFAEGWSGRWVEAQREELQLRFIDVLRRLGDLRVQLGLLGEAEDAYRTLLLEDPLEEGVHVAMMRIYAARGRRDLVNRQFQRLRDVLRHELAVEPSPPTLEVFNELMMGPSQRR